MRRIAILLFVSSIFAAVAAPAPASAQAVESLGIDPDAGDTEPGPLDWRDHWGRYTWWDFAATLGGGALSLTGQSLVRDEPVWTGPLLYDSEVRGAFFIEDQEGRDLADRISDVPYLAGTFLVWSLDPIIAWARGAPDTALQLFLMGLEVFAVVGGTSMFLIGLTGRGRPGVTDACFEDPELGGCEPQEAKSFPSGHTSVAVAAASMWLVTHHKLPIFGSTWADIGLGVFSMSLAVTGGILRIAANKHYATDVTVGALLGLAGGLGIPLLRYFHQDPEDRVTFAPWVAGDGGGLVLTKRW